MTKSPENKSLFHIFRTLLGAAMGFSRSHRGGATKKGVGDPSRSPLNFAGPACPAISTPGLGILINVDASCGRVKEKMKKW
jgi:hypothetical protein